jgi:hypothetical protein
MSSDEKAAFSGLQFSRLSLIQGLMGVMKRAWRRIFGR